METLNRKSDADIKECCEAQEKYCKEKQYPHFAPSSGKCWACNRNIYQNYGWKQGDWRHTISENGAQVDRITGISFEGSGNELVTGCPHCNRSYCD